MWRTSTSDSLNSTFSGQVQIETDWASVYTARKNFSLQPNRPMWSLFSRFYFCLQQFCWQCRCLFAVLLFDGWFCSRFSRIRSSVSARDSYRCLYIHPYPYIYIYTHIVQLEHVDAIGTTEVISHSSPIYVWCGASVLLLLTSSLSFFLLLRFCLFFSVSLFHSTNRSTVRLVQYAKCALI